MQKTKQNAIFHRINVRPWLCAFALGCLPLAASAAYTTLTPPPGWTAGGGAVVAGSGGSYAATTANAWIANASKSSAMLNVGGRQIAMPVTMKLAPTAGRVAAAALFISPHLRAAAGIAAWLGVAGIVWDAVDGKWKTAGAPDTQFSNGYEYRFPTEPWAYSAQGACTAWGATYAAKNSKMKLVSATATDTQCNIITEVIDASVGYPVGYRFTRTDYLEKRASASCPTGWYVTPAGCVQNKPLGQPLTQEEMADLLNPDNTPGWPSPTVPGEFPPGTPFPIELPLVNPSPGANPVPVPYFVPTGQPVPNPQYNPNAPAGPGNQPWKQPGTTVTPQPVPGNPWRVDISPTDREQAGPNPLPDTEQNPNKDPNTDKPKPEEQIGLCELYPDILACAKPELDTPDGEIPKSTRNVELTQENLFGGGGCPADVYFAPHGLQQLKIWDWNRACSDITTYVKPVVLLLSTFAAFMILVPGRTE